MENEGDTSAGHRRLQEAYEDRVRVLNAAIQQRERELLTLSHTATRVHGAESEQEIFDIALEEILIRMDLRAAWIFVGDVNEQKLRLAAARGVSPGFLEQVKRHGLEACLCPEVFWSGHHMQARNTTHCPRMPDIVTGLDAPVAHACIPLQFDPVTRGVLNVAARPGEVFSEDELRFLDTLGHQIGLAVTRARLYDGARRALRELRDAQEQVIQGEKMAVLGTFAAGLAHEVRNPLNSMGLQLSILERRIGRLEPERSKEMSEIAGIIREEIQRLDSLVSDFLLFAGTSRLHFRAASLASLVEEVVTFLQPEARKDGVSVECEASGEPIPDLRMDVEKIKQVLLNLVRNAMEAMPEGGTVSVETGRVAERARIVVRDTGPGLPPGLDVFQIFVTTKAKGTGLGLSIVQQIVVQHGGEITAGREPGKGARFEIFLPLPPTPGTGKEAMPS